jgi:hypothetical protein
VTAAIVFAVDRSSAISPEEMKAQVQAHVNLLRSPEFLAKALDGKSCLGLHYLEWSSAGDVNEVLPWTTVCSAAKAEVAAAEIERLGGRLPVDGSRPSSSLSFAIDSARSALKMMPFRATRKIINISTDGASKDGLPPAEARDRAAKENCIINAIGLVANDQATESELKDYFNQNVVTGDGAFALASKDPKVYEQLILQKTLLQIKAAARQKAKLAPM